MSSPVAQAGPPWEPAEPPDGGPVGKCGHRALDATLGCRDPIHPDPLDVIGDADGAAERLVAVNEADLRTVLGLADAVLYAGQETRDAVAEASGRPYSRARAAAARLRAVCRGEA